MDEMMVALTVVHWIELWVVCLVVASVGEMVQMDEMMVALMAVHWVELSVVRVVVQSVK